MEESHRPLFFVGLLLIILSLDVLQLFIKYGGKDRYRV